jgi:hypothetical protein
MTISKIWRRKAVLLTRWSALHPESTRAPPALPQSALEHPQPQWMLQASTTAAPAGLVTAGEWQGERCRTQINNSGKRVQLEPARTAGDLIDAVLEDLARDRPLTEHELLHYTASDALEV